KTPGLNQPQRRFQQHRLSASGRAEQDPGVSSQHFEGDIVQSRFVVKQDRDMVEFQRDNAGIVLHQVFAWLTNILVTKNVRMTINTSAITAACVGAGPTPCVPPEGRKP